MKTFLSDGIHEVLLNRETEENKENIDKDIRNCKTF
jgi:hypothetical protein